MFAYEIQLFVPSFVSRGGRPSSKSLAVKDYSNPEWNTLPHESREKMEKVSWSGNSGGRASDGRSELGIEAIHWEVFSDDTWESLEPQKFHSDEQN